MEIGCANIIPSRWPMHRGIAPCKLFLERSKFFSDLSWHNCEGIQPLNMFCRNLRTCNEVKVFTVQDDGILPESWFSPRYKINNCFKFLKDVGNSPRRLLLFKCNQSNEERFPNELGNAPVSLLDDNFISDNNLEFHQINCSLKGQGL